MEWSDAMLLPYKPPTKPKALQQSLGKQAAEATLAEMPWHERALVGAGKAAADVGRTFGIGPAEASEADKALTDDTAGMLGNVAGEIGMTLAPGTGAFKAGAASDQGGKARQDGTVGRRRRGSGCCQRGAAQPRSLDLALPSVPRSPLL